MVNALKHSLVFQANVPPAITQRLRGAVKSEFITGHTVESEPVIPDGKMKLNGTALGKGISSLRGRRGFTKLMMAKGTSRM
jgi:hypothetical protein